MDPTTERDMKRTLTAAVIAAVLCSTAAQASAIRVDGGRVMISTGDRAARLNQHLGNPLYGEMGWVCKKPSNYKCDRGDRGAGWGRILQYEAGGRNWDVEVYDGVITRIEWAR